MSFHEVPHDLDALDVSVVEGIVMIVVSVTLNNLKNKMSRPSSKHCTVIAPHLFAEVTASPGLTGPPMDAVHVCGIRLTLQVAVHRAEDVGEMDHLDVVVPPVARNHGVVRPRPEVIRTVGREGDRPVVEAVEVDDVYWRVRHGVVTSQWRAADRSNRGQRG